MAKSKKMTIVSVSADPKQIYETIKAGIKVYPINRNYKWYIQVDDNGFVKTYQKSIQQHELNSAIASTIIHYYNKLFPTNTNTK